MNKVWYTSKQAWINIIGGFAALFADPTVSGLLFGTVPGTALVPARALPWIALVVAALNFTLRWLKTQSNGGLTLTSQPTDLGNVKPPIGVVFALICLGLVGAGCAGSFKAKAVGGYSAVETLFATVDDGERVGCYGSLVLPPVPQRSHCTAGVPGVTDAVHETVTRKLIAAYDAQLRLAPVLHGLKVADSADLKDVTTLATLAGDVQQIADTLPVNPLVALWAHDIQKWATAIADVKKTLGGGK